jgi:hypothetical protein
LNVSLRDGEMRDDFGMFASIRRVLRKLFSDGSSKLNKRLLRLWREICSLRPPAYFIQNELKAWNDCEGLRGGMNDIGCYALG